MRVPDDFYAYYDPTAIGWWVCNRQNPEAKRLFLDTDGGLTEEDQQRQGLELYRWAEEVREHLAAAQ